jgi:hypothetical protein
MRHEGLHVCTYRASEIFAARQPSHGAYGDYYDRDIHLQKYATTVLND